MNEPTSSSPKISVIILNYNGQRWLDRCFASLEEQTIFSSIEVIFTDNHSADGSDQYAKAWLDRHSKGYVFQNGANLGYCEANNNGASIAKGQYLLFLNNDTWLEPDCLEKLFNAVEASGAKAATPQVRNYEDDTDQDYGAAGIDWMGLPTHQNKWSGTTELFTACGCSYFIRADWFRKIGGFDNKLFIYADETDLSMRVWIAGGKIVGIPEAHLHHRGAAVVNPEGNTRQVEARTSDRKRFLANRNGVLFILKNGEHILLLLLVPHLLLLAAEGLVALLLVRRWSYVQTSYLSAIADCWRLRGHVLAWRRAIKKFRVRSDWWIIRRFLRLKPGRFQEVMRLLKFGAPKVDSR